MKSAGVSWSYGRIFPTHKHIDRVDQDVIRQEKGGMMKKMDLGVGSLILLGFLLVIGGLLAKFSGINIMDPFMNDISSFFIAANACFLAALVVDYFGASDN